MDFKEITCMKCSAALLRSKENKEFFTCQFCGMNYHFDDDDVYIERYIEQHIHIYNKDEKEIELIRKRGHISLPVEIEEITAKANILAEQMLKDRHKETNNIIITKSENNYKSNEIEKLKVSEKSDSTYRYNAKFNDENNNISPVVEKKFPYKELTKSNFKAVDDLEAKLMQSEIDKKWIEERRLKKDIFLNYIKKHEVNIGAAIISILIIIVIIVSIIIEQNMWN